MKTKKEQTKTLKNFLIVLFVAFLALPIIFPETNPIKMLSKENSIKHEESPLPVFSQDNMLTKYVKRLKQFYNLEKEEEFEKEEISKSQNDDISAYDLFFASDNDDETPILFADANSTKPEDSIDIKNGTVKTYNGLLLSPTQDGYYYQDQFYKNGTYPANINKKTIEGALSRYHNAVAKNSGKKAIYYADDKGNLTVDYVKEYPTSMLADIENYLAKNRKNIGTFAKAKALDFERYRGATINGAKNKSDSGSNSTKGNGDVATESLRDMHSAYSLLLQKIRSGEFLKENDMDKPGNLINMDVINAINQMPAAQDPTSAISKENFCKEGECDNAFTIAPKIDSMGDSDLYNYYHSFCDNGNGICPSFTNNFHDNKELSNNFDFNNPEDIKQLKSDIENSEKTIIEIGYMHLTPESIAKYAEFIQELNNMGLTNKNQEKVKVLLRGFNFKTQDPGSDFGYKLIAPMRANIKRDIINNNPDNDIFSTDNSYDPVGDLAGEYQAIYDNVQNEYKGKQNLNDILTNYNIKENPKDMPIAIVQKQHGKANSSFIVNSSFIPGGYRTDIPEWEQYFREGKYGAYYEVPRDVLLNNSPKNLAIVFLQTDEKDSTIKLADNHPVTTMSVQDIFNFNKSSVRDNVAKIYETQATTAIFNAKQKRLADPLPKMKTVTAQEALLKK